MDKFPQMKRLHLFALLLFASLASAQQSNNTPVAVQATPSPTTAIAMWRATLPGGTYSVALRSIVSVSSHEYVVDGAARVTEVNIDTAGSALVRFYFIEPNTVNAPAGFGAATLEKTQQILQEADKRTLGKRLLKVTQPPPIPERLNIELPPRRS